MGKTIVGPYFIRMSSIYEKRTFDFVLKVLSAKVLSYEDIAVQVLRTSCHRPRRPDTSYQTGQSDSRRREARQRENRH